MNENMTSLVKLGIDAVNKIPVTDFSEGDRNEAMRGKFLEIMGTEKFDPMAYDAHKYEVFQVIREVIQQTIADGEGAMSAFYNQFVEERNIAWGDSQTFEIENDAYLTVGKVSGNNWDLDRQRVDKGASIPVATDAYYVKVFEYFKRFMTGRMSFEDLVGKVDVAIKKFKDDAVAEAFVSATKGLPSKFVYTGAYNQTEIQRVLDYVSGANAGEVITLVGTKGALNKLQGITIGNLSDSQKAEYNSKGFIREWNGYVCAELPTVLKANSIEEFAFNNTDIYVLPSNVKPVKVVNEGSVLVQETDEKMNKDMTKNFAVIFNIGFIAIFNKLFGKISITG